jgi:hypothetical protein
MWIVQTVFVALYILKFGQDGFLTRHVIEIREDALFEATKFNESRHFWPGIQKVVRRPGFVAIYIAQHQAHIIPNRAFRSKEERNRFVDLLREKVRGDDNT